MTIRSLRETVTFRAPDLADAQKIDASLAND